MNTLFSPAGSGTLNGHIQSSQMDSFNQSIFNPFNNPDLDMKNPNIKLASMSQNEIMKTPFLLFQSHKDDYYNASQQMLSGIQEENILSKVFFSPKNVKLIQKQMIRAVYKESNGEFLVEPQDEADLMVVMRSMFIQHARNYPDHIPEQIQELNNLVVDDIIPGIISWCKAYFGYLERTFEPLYFLDRPECVSSAGTKTLPSVTRTFH